MIRNLVLTAVLMLVPVAAMGASDDDLDVRLKFGTAAQTDEGKIGTSSGPISGEQSSNAQVEIQYSHYVSPAMSVVFGAGIFSRTHSGSENIGVGNGSTTFDYDAKGLSVAAGLGFKPSDNLRWEGRLEVGAGTGTPTLSTPGLVWNKTDSGTYTSASLIFGGYYSFAKPGIELGLELGSQSFTGDWKIWNNNGYWMDSQVKGSSVTANLVLGYRF